MWKCKKCGGEINLNEVEGYKARYEVTKNKDRRIFLDDDDWFIVGYFGCDKCEKYVFEDELETIAEWVEEE